MKYLSKSARPYSAICIWRNSHRHINSLQKERRWEARSRPGSGTDAASCISRPICAVYSSRHADSKRCLCLQMEAMHKLQQENIQKQLMAQQLLLQQQVCPIPRLFVSKYSCQSTRARLCFNTTGSAASAANAVHWLITLLAVHPICASDVLSWVAADSSVLKMFSSTHRVWPEG